MSKKIHINENIVYRQIDKNLPICHPAEGTEIFFVILWVHTC